jgi:hypothetical protein
LQPFAVFAGSRLCLRHQFLSAKTTNNLNRQVGKNAKKGRNQHGILGILRVLGGFIYVRRFNSQTTLASGLFAVLSCGG